MDKKKAASVISKVINKIHGIDKQKPLVEGVDYDFPKKGQDVQLPQEFFDNWRNEQQKKSADGQGIGSSVGYQQAADIRKKGLFSTITDKLIAGQGIGSSVGGAISEKTQATVKGFKEKFDILNIAKTLTGGSNLAPALLGKVLGRKKEDNAYFAGVKNKKIDGLSSKKTNEMAVEVLGLIYREMVRTEEQRKIDFADAEEEKNKELKAEDTRNKQIIAALTGRKRSTKRVKVEKETKEKKEPTKKDKTPTSKKTFIGEALNRAISTVTKVGKPAAILGAAGVVVAGSSGLFSRAAMATIKSEQGVKSEADALAPNNDPKRVKKGEFPDLETPKLGAATPDTRGSTSYGLFGINNIRNKGKSSIDLFVEQNPQLNLPNPGSSENPEQVKKFNEAWWNLSKTRPKELLEAQANYFKRNVEEVAVKSLSGLPSNISNNSGVQDYMIDRYTQFGNTMIQSAIQYASGAKNPEQFINLMSKHDKNNLRQIFKSTSDSEFKKLEKGLINRIDARNKDALGVISENVNAPSESVLATGQKIDTISKVNKDARAQADASAVQQKNVNTTNVSSSNQQTQNTEKEDDRSAYDKKVKQR
jgi:hypothetical protein